MKRHGPRPVSRSRAVGRYAFAVTRARAENQPPILKTFVPHFWQMPESAGLPFFIVTFFVSMASRLALHLTQYTSGMF